MPKSEFTVTERSEWELFLNDWEMSLFDLMQSYQDVLMEEEQDALERSRLTFSAAGKSAIEQAERRIGAPLPPSYARFSSITIGWTSLGISSNTHLFRQ